MLNRRGSGINTQLQSPQSQLQSQSQLQYNNNNNNNSFNNVNSLGSRGATESTSDNNNSVNNRSSLADGVININNNNDNLYSGRMGGHYDDTASVKAKSDYGIDKYNFNNNGNSFKNNNINNNSNNINNNNNLYSRHMGRQFDDTSLVKRKSDTRINKYNFNNNNISRSQREFHSARSNKFINNNNNNNNNNINIFSNNPGLAELYDTPSQSHQDRSNVCNLSYVYLYFNVFCLFLQRIEARRQQWLTCPRVIPGVTNFKAAKDYKDMQQRQIRNNNEINNNNNSNNNNTNVEVCVCFFVTN